MQTESSSHKQRAALQTGESSSQTEHLSKTECYNSHKQRAPLKNKELLSQTEYIQKYVQYV